MSNLQIKNFIPKTLDFRKSEYQIKGEKLKDREYCKVNINGKETKGDDFEYFDSDESGTATWTELLVFLAFGKNLNTRLKNKNLILSKIKN